MSSEALTTNQRILWYKESTSATSPGLHQCRPLEALALLTSLAWKQFCSSSACTFENVASFSFRKSLSINSLSIFLERASFSFERDLLRCFRRYHRIAFGAFIIPSLALIRYTGSKHETHDCPGDMPRMVLLRLDSRCGGGVPLPFDWEVLEFLVSLCHVSGGCCPLLSLRPGAWEKECLALFCLWMQSFGKTFSCVS